MTWILEILWNVILAAGILVAAFWLSGWVKQWIERWAREYDHIDETLFTFLGAIARYAILGIALIFVLAQFGVQTTALVAVLGAAGLAIGLALQGTLSNIAAGVMLIVFRPFKIGDFVDVNGGSGTVRAVNLFTTELTTVDNLQVIIPNKDVFGSAITNYSYHDRRRVDLVFGVGYGADLKKAEEIIFAQIDADDRILDDPQPFVKVSALSDSSVDFTVRAWVERGDYFNVKCDLQRAVKEAFDAGGIDIPFPSRTVYQSS